MSLLKNETKTCRCGGSTGCCYFFAGNMLFIRHSLFINFLLVFPREPQCFSVLLILVLLLTLLVVLCSVLFFVLIFVNHAAARIIRDYDQKCMIKYWHHQNWVLIDIHRANKHEYKWDTAVPCYQFASQTLKQNIKTRAELGTRQRQRVNV